MDMKSRRFPVSPVLRIREVDCYLVEGRASSEASICRSLLVRLTGQAGQEGWGEGPPLWSRSELPSRKEALAAVLQDRSAFDIAELSNLDLLRTPGLRSAVEMACWDLIGKQVREPVCHLWGGRYRNYVPLGVRLPLLESAASSGAFARELAEQGFHTLVLPTTGQIETDLQWVAAIRQSTGERPRLHLDGLAQYDELTAQDLCAALEYQGLQGLVDPLASSEVYPLASLARQTSVPIGVHRPLRSLVQVLSAVRSGAGAFMVLDCDLLGGMTPVRKSAAVAEAAGVPVLLNDAGGVGVRLAALVHLNAAMPFLAQACLSDCYGGPNELFCQSLEIVEGMIAVPEGPGWGVEVDMAKLEES